MTVDELLQPRVKVTNDFWDNPFKVGDIIKFEVYDYGWYTPLYHFPSCSTRYSLDAFTNYPHLFQPLPWWQDREPKDMPEFVKGNLGGITKAHKWIIKDGYCSFKCDDGYFHDPSYYTPATLADYEQYINSK